MFTSASTRLYAVLSLISLAALPGCSSSSDSSGGDPQGQVSMEAFSSYCTGTLLVQHKLMEPSGPGGWFSDGSQGSAAVGTTFLVATSFDRWEGFLISSGGPRKISADFQTGLVKDTHFTSDCATDDKLGFAHAHDVLLADSTFYPNEDLSGDPCTLPAATELTSFGFSNFSSVASVSAAEIKSECALEKAYSVDLRYASLILK